LEHGLLKPGDRKAQWIPFRDTSPLHRNHDQLYLPPARYYRKELVSTKPVKRAMLYASALGLMDLCLNGQDPGDAYFEPGWADYHKRAHYRTCDVTSLLKPGTNGVGAIVTDGLVCRLRRLRTARRLRTKQDRQQFLWQNALATPAARNRIHRRLARDRRHRHHLEGERRRPDP
jgi:hypothetical protein